jgi:hypothetical protein
MITSKERGVSLLLGIKVILIISININCKKGGSTAPTNNVSIIDPTGKWRLESSTSVQNGNSYTLTSIQHPCIANNTITVNSNGTIIVAYDANDTCYIINTPTQIEILGEKGDYADGTWAESQNTLYMTLPTRNVSRKPAQLSLLNSKYQMIFRDTFASINLITTDVFSK